VISAALLFFLEVNKISFSTSSLKLDLVWLQYKSRIMSGSPSGLGINRVDQTMLEGCFDIASQEDVGNSLGISCFVGVCGVMASLFSDRLSDQLWVSFSSVSDLYRELF
jgi:hypothetical protein